MNRRSGRLLLTLGALGLVLSGAASAGERPLAERLDRVIDRALADKRIVGTVVLVAEDGKVIYHRAAGEADREAHKPMREDTLFRLASLSKPITSSAALRLVEEGKLGLDEPITRWLPTFQPRRPDGQPAVITVRQLLSHTAGLTYVSYEAEGGPYHQAHVSDGMDQPGLSQEENLRRLASVPLVYEPGKGWGYSNATDVLGAVVASASGQPLPKAVEQLITRPLGMKDTGFTVREAARLATPYADGEPEPIRMGETQAVPYLGTSLHFVPGRVFDAHSFPSGGAGMVGTAGDFLKLLEAVRKGGAPVLKPETARLISTNQIGERQSVAPGWGFGLGAAVLVDPTRAHSAQPVGTWRWWGAYGHSWFVDPQRKLTVVALTNTSLEGMSGVFPSDLEAALYGGVSGFVPPGTGPSH